jgi:hypothetical protein
MAGAGLFMVWRANVLSRATARGIFETTETWDNYIMAKLYSRVRLTQVVHWRAFGFISWLGQRFSVIHKAQTGSVGHPACYTMSCGAMRLELEAVGNVFGVYSVRISLGHMLFRLIFLFISSVPLVVVRGQYLQLLLPHPLQILFLSNPIVRCQIDKRVVL